MPPWNELCSEAGGGAKGRPKPPLARGWESLVARSFHRVVGQGLRLGEGLFDGLLSSISGRELLAYFRGRVRSALSLAVASSKRAELRATISSMICIGSWPEAISLAASAPPDWRDAKAARVSLARLRIEPLRGQSAAATPSQPRRNWHFCRYAGIGNPHFPSNCVI